MTLPLDWLRKFGWPLSLTNRRPLAIAHRGASAYAPENSMAAFQIAADLSSELWEIDIHLSSDGVCVVAHDDDLLRMTGQPLQISGATWGEICNLRMPDGELIPRLEEVIALARQTGSGLYIEIKSEGAGVKAWQTLEEASFKFASLGSFNVRWIDELRQAGCKYPLSIFVPPGVDPFDYVGARNVEIIHLCWENGSDRPQDLLTEELISNLQGRNLQIVLWHEERADVINELLEKPVMGICSNSPEMLKPYRQTTDQPIDIVCHRGINALAPENTLHAAQLCIDQGFQFVEIDVRTTLDGEIVVIHDANLDRTTSGSGPVHQHTAEEISKMEAGSWFSDGAKGLRVPTLSQILQLAYQRIGVYVEIKQAAAAAVLEIVAAHKMLPHCFFWSSDTDALRWMRQQSREVQLMAPMWMYRTVEEAIQDYGAQIVEFDVTQDDLSNVSVCKDLGVRSMIYCQSHDPSDLGQYLAYKPDMVNLDAPSRFKILADYPDVQKHFDLKNSFN